MDESCLIKYELQKHLPSEFTDKFSLFTNESDIDISKELIYWCQLYPNDNTINYLKDTGLFDRIKCFVFVSNWQSELYRVKYGIPGEKSKVIKNACYRLVPDQETEVLQKKNNLEKIKICYANAPWKGLRILLSTWDQLNTVDCELEILYHNMDGIDMSRIKNKCDSYDNVKFIEDKNYGNILKKICEAHIMVYPALYADVSNIYISNAISSGVRVVTTSTGALPEITEGWARIYSFIENETYHTIRLSGVLEDEINKMRGKNYDDLLRVQKSIYAPSWSWGNRIHEWNEFISSLKNL